MWSLKCVGVYLVINSTQTARLRISNSLIVRWPEIGLAILVRIVVNYGQRAELIKNVHSSVEKLKVLI